MVRWGVGGGLSWGSVVERLMRAPVLVEVDPGSDLHPRMLQGGEALCPAQLLFEGLDEPLAQAVLLRRVGRDELLFRP